MIIPSTKYPSQTAIDLTNYPQGKARNVVATGDGSGTPLEKSWINDWFGFQQAAVLAAGITPSGVSDTALASDVLDAIKALILKRTIAAYDITSAATVAIGGAYPLTLNQQFGGFVMASNLVQVPVAGKYRVKFDGLLSNTSFTNPSAIAAQVAVAGSGVKVAQSIRYSAAGSSESHSLSCEAVVTVTTPATDKISVIATATTVSFTTTGLLLIERLG